MHVTNCTEHPGCFVIESDGWPDAAGSWASHFDDDVDPAARLNPSDARQAEIEDRRNGAAAEAKVRRRPPTAAERDRIAQGRLPMSERPSR